MMRPMRILLGILLILVSAAYRPAVAQGPISPGTDIGRQPAPVIAPHFVRGPMLATLPTVTPEEQARLEQAWADQARVRAAYRVPIDPTASVAVMPANPPTEARPLSWRLRPAAPGDFAVYRDAISECTDPTCWFRDPNEPTMSANGRMVLHASNTYGMVSDDYGQTFSYVDPRTTFPNAAGGVAGDFISYYERTRGLMFWYLQYTRDANGNNVVRVAVATSQANLANNAWHYYDITPQLMGYPTNQWFDYPDMAASANRLYITTNVCSGGSCSGSMTFRLDLDVIAAAGQLTLENFTSTLNSLRVAPNNDATAYLGAQVDNNTLRIYTWNEGSAAPTSVDRDVDAWQTGVSTATSPDGTNWLGADNKRIIAAFIAGGRLGFMWDSAQGGAYTQANVRFARFNLPDLNLSDQGAIWNANHAWAYPSAGTNDRGHAGGTLHYGGNATAPPGGGSYPALAAWIADSFNNQALAPLENVTLAIGTNGPASNRWGDYTSTRAHSMYSNTWIGTGYVLNPATTGTYEPHFAWFGREQDHPPAANTLYVSRFATSWQNGAFLHPYHTIALGHFATVPGDSVQMVPGIYHEVLTLDRAGTYYRFGNSGTVVIGQWANQETEE